MTTFGDLTPAPEPWRSNIQHLVEANQELGARVMWLKKRVAELEELVRQLTANRV